MLKAEVEMQLEWVKKGRSMMHSASLLAKAGYRKTYFEKHEATMEELCHAFLEILPQLCQHEEPEQGVVLQHDKLSASNILVDPTSYKITAIVGWGRARLAPRWMASVHPELLQGTEYLADVETEPPIPPYENEGADDLDDEEDRAIIMRDHWEAKQLRDLFDSTIKALVANDVAFAADDDDDDDDDVSQVETMRNFKRKTWEITANTVRAQEWLEDYRLGVGDLTPKERWNISEASLAELIAERAAMQNEESDSSGGETC